jgi:hypothetical protein
MNRTIVALVSAAFAMTVGALGEHEKQLKKAATP